ncbi:MAG TPA: DUF2855 family protein [Acidimicrobiia bacterium]|nr:DUF2855 family protein [Acidimicrobiia bacterium]
MELLVARDDLRSSRFVDAPAPEPGPGEVRFRIEKFALTANNITYAVFGDMMAYWQFFPTEPGWGRIPVWGFATVDASNVDGVATGERFYGYFPMASHLVVTPDRVGSAGFVDAAPHRAGLPSVYNHYARLGHGTEGPGDDYEALLRPLFTTSFLIDDWLDEQGFFGATQVVIGSASSKTALGLAHVLATRRDLRVIGLTSPSNADFVGAVGYYDAVVPYGALGAEPRDVPTVFVDMAGDGGVVAEVHRHFAEQLAHSCRVGATHWEEMVMDAALPGPEPVLFFAPDQVERRREDWGPGGVEERVGAALAEFIESARGWLKITEGRGEAAVGAAYLDVLEGRARPDEGIILSL